MSKKKVFAIVLFLVIGLTMFTFAGTGDSSGNLIQLEDDNPGDSTQPENPVPPTQPDDLIPPVIPDGDNQANITNQNTNRDTTVRQPARVPSPINPPEPNESGDEEDSSESIPTKVPVINIEGDLNIALGTDDAITNGVSLILDATDKTTTISDIEILGFNKNVLGLQTISYKITDIYGKTATIQRQVNVIDNEKPTFDFKYTNTVQQINGEFKMHTHTVTDNSGEEIIAVITGYDMSKLGTQTVTYTATDSSGNIAVETTTLKVVRNEDLETWAVTDVKAALSENTFVVGTPKEEILSKLTVNIFKNNGADIMNAKDTKYIVTGIKTSLDEDRLSRTRKLKVKVTYNDKEGKEVTITKKVKYTIINTYKLSVYTNLAGEETLLSNCGNTGKLAKSNIINECNVFNSKMDRYTDFENLYDGYILINWTVNGEYYNSLDGLTVTSDTKVVANYEKLTDTNLNLSLAESYSDEGLFGFLDTNLNPAEGNEILLIKLNNRIHTEIDGKIIVHYKDGSREELDAIIENTINFELDTFYYLEVKKDLVDRVEFSYVEKTLEKKYHTIFGVEVPYFVTNKKTYEAKFKYDLEDNMFYHYGIEK